MLRLPLALLMCSAALPAFANDSVAEIGAGGLVLGRNYDIWLTREDLFLSKDLVTVDYVFENRSDKDVETVVAFPMPAIAGIVPGTASDACGPCWMSCPIRRLRGSRERTLA